MAPDGTFGCHTSLFLTVIRLLDGIRVRSGGRAARKTADFPCFRLKFPVPETGNYHQTIDSKDKYPIKTRLTHAKK
jgi:very-short-patch-repair endonuclease